MYTSDAVIRYLPPTETIATAQAIVERLGRYNEDVTETDVLDAFIAVRTVRQRAGATGARSTIRE